MRGQSVIWIFTFKKEIGTKKRGDEERVKKGTDEMIERTEAGNHGERLMEPRPRHQQKMSRSQISDGL